MFYVNGCTLQEMVELAGEEEQVLAEEMAQQFLRENLPEEDFGAPRAAPGKFFFRLFYLFFLGMWSSTVRLLDPVSGKRLVDYPLEQNEAACS
jgi:splicing factor 3B subunit 3